MGLNVLILAAGRQTESSQPPAYLYEHDGKCALEMVFDQFNKLIYDKISICFDADDVIRYHAESVARLVEPKINVHQIESETGGSGCTALLAASQLNQEFELLIVSANELINLDIAAALTEFRQKRYDGATLCFLSINPRYSFVKLGEDGCVIEASQRNPISKNATTGLFWYKHTSYFVESAKKMVLKNNKTDGRFFIAPTFNEMILNGHTIGVKMIESKIYFPLKNNEELRNYQRKTS